MSGDNQSGPVGSALASPFVVNVLDANDNPVQGTTVDFAVTQGGGALSVVSGVTDATGQAQVTLTLGTTAGQNQATATVTGLSTVTFTATGTPPWFEEDWEQFESGADINAEPNYTTTGSSVGEITVETALTGTPWGGDHGIRVALNANPNCNSQPETGVRITNIPNSSVDQPREIWWEVYAKWSSNYETGWGCSNSEHKFLPHYDDDGRRWHFMVGSRGGRQLRTYGDDFDVVPKQWKIPAVTGPNLDARTAIWDDTWYQLRGHYKMGEGDGHVQNWLMALKQSMYLA